jgi:hypothetical protein
MPKLKRKLQLCKELAAAKKNKSLNKRNKELEDDDDTEHLNVDKTLNNVVGNLEENLSNDEYEESSEEGLSNNGIEENFEWFNNEIEENAELLFDNLSKDIENLPLLTSNRPLVYLGNSRTTKYRKKIEAKKNAEKNGQTLNHFFSSNREIVENNNENGNHFNSIINQIELKLNSEKLTPGYRVRLKAVQKYLRLKNKGYGKIEASEIVSDLLNKSKWFSRCVRSWSKAFLEYGDVPKCRRGQHLIGSSILDDEDVKSKISSYLRKNKFNVTNSKFCDYVSEEILPIIGIENKTSIR